MRLTVDFSALEALARKMGARQREIKLDTVELDGLGDLAIELETGLEVDIQDLEINAGGLLAYKGHQVVLYIPDQGRNIDKVLQDGSQGRKFHVADCKTLLRMKAIGRFKERYAVRNGLSPHFRVHGLNSMGRTIEDAEAELLVCQNCLNKLNYQGFTNKSSPGRRKIVDSFSLSEFFSTYSSYFSETPRRSAETVNPDLYSADWREVSRRAREQADWTCQSCTVQLSDHKRLLHVHHVNGNKADNAPRNLEVLCVDCHSKQAHHGHLFVSHADRQLIQQLRRRQQVYTPPRPGSRTETNWQEAFQNADPAVHGLLDMLRHKSFSVPEVGLDIAGPDGEILYSNAELAWPGRRIAVVLREDDASERLKGIGWEVFTVQDAMEWIQRK